MLVVQGISPLTIGSMRGVIRVVYHLPKVNRVESVALKSLAGDIPDRDEDAVSVC